jgi:hypothetical protein
MNHLLGASFTFAVLDDVLCRSTPATAAKFARY